MQTSLTDYAEAARGWIGTRWVHQGRTHAGVDCVGLVIVAARDLGIELPDIAGYRRTPDPKKFVNFILEHSDPQPKPVVGSVGIFRDGNQPCHLAIFAEKHGQLSMIHAYAPRKVVMEEPFTHTWPNRLFATRSIREMV